MKPGMVKRNQFHHGGTGNTVSHPLRLSSQMKANSKTGLSQRPQSTLRSKFLFVGEGPTNKKVRFVKGRSLTENQSLSDSL
jgi:hypothetical protein